MPDKILKSLKFPGLSGTYHIPQLANDYDEDNNYWCGCFCNYEGDVYFCTYQPEDEYSDHSITGPFNPNYWELISYKFDAKHLGQFANFVGSELFDYITRPYEPDIGYMAGQCVDYDGVLQYCIRQTPSPAGQFDYNYWTPFYPYDYEGYVASAIGMVMRSQNYQNLLMQNSSISDVKRLDMDSVSWNLMNQNPDDETEFEYAYCVIDVDSDFDYLISFPNSMIDDNDQPKWNDYFDFPICFKTCIRNETDIDELMSSNPLFDAENFKTLSLMENAVEGYNSEDYDYGQYGRIKWNSKNPFDAIIISVSYYSRAQIQGSDPSDTTEYSDSQTEFISVDTLSRLSPFLSVSQLKAADSASTEQMFKLVQQDYTEVYKSLSDIIVEYDDSHAYTDTKKIPLNEGNIALQFMNFNDAWKDIDIELRVYSNKFGANESIKLKNSDKHIYIVDKNIGSNGELVEWDYFKLRFRYDDDYLDSSQISFINQTLNILRKPKTQSNPNPVNKNDPIAVQQFINLARSYKAAEPIYIINQPTFLQTTSTYRELWLDNFSVDASTFIEACLKGLGFHNTPYSSAWTLPEQYKIFQFNSSLSPDSWIANTDQYSWAVNPYEELAYKWAPYSSSFQGSFPLPNQADDPIIMDATDIFNECGTLAKWMVDKGWRIDTVANLKQTSKLADIQPGDILFFAEQMGMDQAFKIYVADMFRGYNYRNITHAAIVTAVEVNPGLVGGDNPFGYRLRVISVPSILQNYLKQTSGHFEYDPKMEYELQNSNVYTNTNNLSHYMPAFDTLALVCRPNLSSHIKSELEIEAEKLGLHTIPENRTQLEIIKKCRLCSDIEWTPGRDYDRPLPLTGLEDTSYTYTISHGPSISDIDRYEFGYGNIMIDGKFKAGVTYKGMPWTANLPDDAYDDVRPGSNYPYYKGQDNKLKPELFASIIQSEHCPVYIDENDNNKVYPIYGWNSPIDLIKYVFGQNSAWYSLVDNDTDYVFYDGSTFVTWVDYEDDTIFPEDDDESPWNSFYPQLIQLGEVFFDLGETYVGIITDFVKNEFGKIVQIEVTEATRFGLKNPRDKNGKYGNLIRRKMFTIHEFLGYYKLQPRNSYGNMKFPPEPSSNEEM